MKVKGEKGLLLVVYLGERENQIAAAENDTENTEKGMLGDEM